MPLCWPQGALVIEIYFESFASTLDNSELCMKMRYCQIYCCVHIRYMLHLRLGGSSDKWQDIFSVSNFNNY